jgi:hypothetical protein
VTGKPLRKHLVLVGLALAGLMMASSASAQTGMPPGGAMGPPPSGNAKKPKAQPDQPETHAASGADEVSPLQTQEPTLPQEPLDVPAAVAAQIGSSAAVSGAASLGEMISASTF